MPLALVFVGLLLIVTGLNNTYAQFGAQLKSDFTGDKNFVLYIAALGGVGALGYIKALRTFSHYFMALILISLVLSNKGFFHNLTLALNASPIAPNAIPVSAGSSPIPDTPDAKIANNQSGLFGQAPTSGGQAKFNGWLNYILGLSSKSAP